MEKWPHKPIQLIFDYLRDNAESIPGSCLIDLGCGEGKLELMLKEANLFDDVHSYDFLATGGEHIQQCDIKNLPLKNGTVDVAVFCLSLMGVNWVEFVAEANRVLKMGGLMIISEVVSRFESVKMFMEILNLAGMEKVYYVRENLKGHFRNNLGRISILWF
jgi:ribosomal RNA-processing protein 8